MRDGSSWLSKNWPKLLTATIIFVGLVSGYAILRHTVSCNKEDIEKHDAQLEDVKVNQIVFEQEIEEIQEDIEDIDATLTDLDEAQRESHDLLIRVGQELGVEP
jgi:peptidoglycan hydrolase CwlO-like protein